MTVQYLPTGQFGLYLRDRFIRFNLIIGLLVNLVLWLILGWQVKNFSNLIPLHYNIYFGIDLFGPWYRIFLLPAIGIIFLAINFFLGILLFHKEKILSYFLVGSNSLIQTILILAALFIILISY